MNKLLNKRFNNQNIILSILIILFCIFFSISNSIISNDLDPALVVAGKINIPDNNSPQLKIFKESLTLIVYFQALLIKIGLTNYFISNITIIISTLCFFIGIFLITKNLLILFFNYFPNSIAFLYTCLIFLDALINFKNEHVLFEIYSSQIDWIVNEIKVRKLESIVLLKGSMPHKDIPDIQINSSLNIIFGFENYKSYYLKMFEYLGAGRPILLISDEKYKEPTIEIFNKFKYAHVAYNVGGVNKIINQLIKSPSLDLDEKLLDKYKFPYLAKEYLKIINDHNGSR